MPSQEQIRDTIDFHPQREQMKEFVDIISGISSVNPAVVSAIKTESERLKRSKVQVVVIDEDEFDSIVNGKVDFAMDIECGSCVPTEGDTIIFMVSETMGEPAAYVVVNVTYAKVVKALELPANLFKEWVIDHVGYDFNSEVLQLVFEIDADGTIMANGE